MDGDDLQRLAEARYSCRAFRPDPVPPDLIDRLFTIALSSASWSNVQPWKVVVVSGESKRHLSGALLAAAATAGGGRYDIDPPSEFLGVHRERRRAAGFALYNSLSIARDDFAARGTQAMENFRFFGAPHTAIITAEASLGPYALVDCGGFVSTLMLAASSLGLGSIAQAAIAHHSDIVRDQLSIPTSEHVLCAVSFGYADEQHPANAYRTERAALADVVSFVD